MQGYRASAVAPIELSFPGRFSILIGANSAGKTTIAEAIYLAHAKVFPFHRFSSSGLGPGDRSVRVEYAFADEGDRKSVLEEQMRAERGGVVDGSPAASWDVVLTRRLGTVNTNVVESPNNELLDRSYVLYLPASRNPIDELARREARIIIELLRNEQRRSTGSSNLGSVRARASILLQELAKHDLIASLESRIANHLSALTSGVSEHWAFVRGQVVDDTYLARVLELMLAGLEGRDEALPLEVSGLGYVNILHVAVLLAAIPDRQTSERVNAVATDAPSENDVAVSRQGRGGDESTSALQSMAADVHPDMPMVDADGYDLTAASDILRGADAEADAENESLFDSASVHAIVLIEEPEAHLHPQLQQSFVHYLRRVTQERPELQIILTSHAPELVSTSEPEELVVVRKTEQGVATRSLKLHPTADKKRMLRNLRLHLDASRSSAIFASNILLVEGITDAALVRAYGRIWAGSDEQKQSRIDALSIVPMATKVGEWPVELLASREFELVDRLAVLRDSDQVGVDHITYPSWYPKYDRRRVFVALSDPTLEPTIWNVDPALSLAVLQDIGLTSAAMPTDLATFSALFRGSAPGQVAGPLARQKADFALALAARLMDYPTDGSVSVPPAVAAVLDFLCRD